MANQVTSSKHKKRLRSNWLQPMEVRGLPRLYSDPLAAEPVKRSTEHIDFARTILKGHVPNILKPNRNMFVEKKTPKHPARMLFEGVCL